MSYILLLQSFVLLKLSNSGIEYPVHPIDTVTATLDDNNQVMCFSGFPASDGTSTSEDLLLGDSFLRNVYSLYNFGQFVGETDAPFIQLLSVTDAGSASAEFNTLSSQRNQSLTSKDARQGPASGGGSGNGASALLSSPSQMLLSGSLFALCLSAFIL